MKAIVAIFILAFGVYANTLVNGFAMDDGYNVIDNREIDSLRNIPAMFTHAWGATANSNYDRAINQNYYRPLSSGSLAIDRAIWGLTPFGFHLTNALLNALVCATLATWLRTLTGNPAIAVVSALFFALHPVHTEVVNLVTYRTELLATLFSLLALWTYTRSLGRSDRRSVRLSYVATVIFFSAALLCKESAITLPGWMLLVDIATDRLNASNWKVRALSRYLPLGVVAGIYLLLRHRLLHGGEIDFFAGLSWDLRALSVMKIYARYLRLLVWPWPLVPFYDWTILPPATDWHDVDAWIGLVAFISSLALVPLLWRKARWVAVGLAVWTIGLIPFLHLARLPVGAAERFLYFPSIGIALCFGWGTASLLRRNRVATTSLLLLIATAMGGTVVVRNSHWKSDRSIKERVVRDYPSSFVGRVNLGDLLRAEGDLAGAERHLRKANEIWPNFLPSVVKLAEVMIERGDAVGARRLLEEAERVLGPTPVLTQLRARLW